MNADHLNIRHLAAMTAILEHGSISRAASIVNLTQPAVTQGIAKLERQIGLPLFDRRPGGMVATEAAQRLGPHVTAALRFIGSNRVTTAQIRAFVALSRTGSYRAAAAAAGVVEPSLHRAVSDLSLAVGARLVERRGRGVILTGQGAALARRLRLALTELRSGLEEMSDLRGRETGTIAVGAMPLSRARILPQAIRTFRRAWPHVAIRIHEGAYAELIGPLRDGEIDLMIGALREPSISQDLNQRPLFEDRPRIIARAGHPLAQGWDGAALVAYPWILPPEGAPLRDLWRQMFDALGGELPAVPIECGSVMTIRQLLLQENFLTLLSRDQLAIELDDGVLADLGPAVGEISRTIGVTTRADWRPTRMQHRFLDAIVDASTIIDS